MHRLPGRAAMAAFHRCDAECVRRRFAFATKLSNRLEHLNQ
jgi:hypothetical protein